LKPETIVFEHSAFTSVKYMSQYLATFVPI